MNNLEEYSKDILDSIIEIFKKRKEKVTGYIEYRGRAIKVSGKYGTNLWIRVERMESDGLLVNISNVNLRPGIQRKGIFTEICMVLTNKSYIKQLYIGSPSTYEIHRFAQKFRLEYDNNYARYIVKMQKHK